MGVLVFDLLGSEQIFTEFGPACPVWAELGLNSDMFWSDSGKLGRTQTKLAGLRPKLARVRQMLVNHSRFRLA